MRQGSVRRITKLHVNEISLVDRPANREPFLLYKSEGGGVAAPMTHAEAEAEADAQIPELSELAKAKGNPAKEKYLNDDGTFKDGFDGCMGYQKDEQGLDDDSSRKVCAFIGRKAGKIPAGKREDEVKPVATPDVLARFADGGRSAEATKSGLVKYDSSAVFGALDRVLALDKDSQGAINPNSGDAWRGGVQHPEGSERRQNPAQAILSAARGFDPGMPNAGSQSSIDPEADDKWDASMIGPVGGERKKDVGLAVDYGPTGSPLSQGGSPKGASQAAI